MLLKFKCPNCQVIFEDKGTKIEYSSSVYGPCFKYIAYCPSCKTEADEYRSPVTKKSVKSYEGHSCDKCCCNCN